VTRKGADGEPEGGWFPEQTVDVDVALRSMSAGSAYAAFQEEQLGQLSPGSFADFTVLAVDPRKIPAEELRTMDVTMTVVGGEVTFQ
ncbi:MAG: amidohydrolase, partial [Gammaproteobacteria bacterium]